MFSRHAFVVYPLAVQAIGATHIEVPARDYGHDLEAMAAAIRPDTKIVFLANPNNPTGTFFAGSGHALLARVPAQRAGGAGRGLWRIPSPPALQSPTAGWFAQFPNVVISRTLSKAYGLAGLRVGFGLSPRKVASS